MIYTVVPIKTGDFNGQLWNRINKKASAMGRLFNLFTKKEDVQLSKASTGEWIVKRNLQILYIGSKEKCQIFMSQLSAA